jgi:hypothetical protein
MKAGVKFEREAVRELPDLLEDLLGRRPATVSREVLAPDGHRVDAIVEVDGQTWLFEAKSSSRPGVVAAAKEQLERYAELIEADMSILVVPYMTPAGSKTAADVNLNWIDLSGNASIREGDNFRIHVEGKPNRYPQRGRPSSPFAPKSARITRELLIEPQRWWRQKEIVVVTGLDDGHVSRTVGRLRGEELLEESELGLRPRDPLLLLEAWAAEYRFDRHEFVYGHISGSGIELARELAGRLADADVDHAFTGLPAAWLLSRFAGFRLNSVYVKGDPLEVADEIGLRLEERGANVQLLVPDDEGVFSGEHQLDGVDCVSPPQVYVDLIHLPERAPEAAEELRRGGLWDGSAG